MKPVSSQFLIGATSSGSGKTTITLGLLRAFRNRGLKVQPFKCGPDYIDTKFHKIASGKDSINLDLFFSSPEHVREIYGKYAHVADVSIAEGVMGLFDGYEKSFGSSAEVAKTLGLPIILILTPQSMAFSAAAILHGFKSFDPGLRVVGVIFNKVKSESHYRFLKDAADVVGLRSFGYLPPNDELVVPSRHLGLVADREEEIDILSDRAAAHIEKYLDVDEILASTVCQMQWKKKMNHSVGRSFTSAVAYDEAFSFIYRENIAYLENRGAVTLFSPLKDKELPKADFLYIPGGYPENYLEELSGNHEMIRSIRAYVEGGGKVLAECGGMMYLSKMIKDEKGVAYPMVGVFNQEATFEGMRLKLGYRQIEYNGMHLKGHEFHYSKLLGDLPSIAQQMSATGRMVETKLLRYKNALASYTHLYWAEIEDLMILFDEV